MPDTAGYWRKAPKVTGKRNISYGAWLLLVTTEDVYSCVIIVYGGRQRHLRS